MSRIDISHTSDELTTPGADDIQQTETNHEPEDGQPEDEDEQFDDEAETDPESLSPSVSQSPSSPLSPEPVQRPELPNRSSNMRDLGLMSFASIEDNEGAMHEQWARETLVLLYMTVTMRRAQRLEQRVLTEEQAEETIEKALGSEEIGGSATKLLQKILAVRTTCKRLVSLGGVAHTNWRCVPAGLFSGAVVGFSGWTMPDDRLVAA